MLVQPREIGDVAMRGDRLRLEDDRCDGRIDITTVIGDELADRRIALGDERSAIEQLAGP